MWPVIASQVLMGLAFTGADYLRERKRSSWGRRIAGGMLPSAAMAGANWLERQAYESDWADYGYQEQGYAQGFNPRSWGRESEVGPYGMGSW